MSAEHQYSRGVMSTVTSLQNLYTGLTGNDSVLVTVSRSGRGSSFPGRGTVLLSANPGNTRAYKETDSKPASVNIRHHMVETRESRIEATFMNILELGENFTSTDFPLSSSFANFSCERTFRNSSRTDFISYAANYLQFAVAGLEVCGVQMFHVTQFSKKCCGVYVWSTISN